jgi:hypothetical protein
MCKTKITTTIDQDLFAMAKEKALEIGLNKINAIIEEALKLYFANYKTEVWERVDDDSILHKLIIRPEKVIFETVTVRKAWDYDPEMLSQVQLSSKGFKRVWYLKRHL